MKPDSFRPDIDGLRAIAVLLVIGYHFFPEAICSGFIGVDIFFVISGYLITRNILGEINRNTFNIFSFYSRRIQRIFPALIVVLMAVYTMGWWILLTDEFKNLGLHIFGGAGFISNFLYWKETGYFDGLAESKPLLHLWSLGIEEQFYILWPVLVGLSLKRLNSIKFILILILISFGWNVHQAWTDASGAYYSPWGRFWQLGVGGMMNFVSYSGIIKPHQESKINMPSLSPHGLSAIGGCFLMLGALLIDKRTPFPGLVAIFPTLGAAMMILAGPKALINQYLLSNKVLVAIGLVSYPLYLWHWPYFSFASIMTGGELHLWLKTTLIFLSFISAWLTFKLIESPLRKNPPTTRKITALLVGMTIMGILGWNTFQRNGLEFRSAAKGIGHDFSFARNYIESCTPITHVKGDDWCHLSKAGTDPEYLLVGDSHANAFSTVMGGWLESGFVQLGRGECPGLINYGRPECVEIARIAHDYAKRPYIHTVILASRWPIYFNGFSRDRHANDQFDFLSSLKVTIDAYRNIGKKVIFVYTVPTGANPRKCVRRSTRLNECDIPLDAAKENDGEYRTWIHPAHVDYANMIFFDPWPALCQNGYCMVQHMGKILYLDGDHLSSWGGALIADRSRRIAIENGIIKSP